MSESQTNNQTKQQAEATPLILIVDDDRTMRSLLNLAMEEEGYRVIEAENGEQCLSEYAHFEPDLILLDAVMPDIDGFSCCRKIRGLPGSNCIPILMVTVLDDQGSVEQAFSAGATDYITKPIHWSVLSQRVRRLLQDRQTRIDLQKVQTQLQQKLAYSQLTTEILEQLIAEKDLQNAIQQVLSITQQRLEVAAVSFECLTSIPRNQSLPCQYATHPNFLELDVNLSPKDWEQYQKGSVTIIEDVTEAGLSLSVKQQLQQSQIQALWIVPIEKDRQNLGLLTVYCSKKLTDNRKLNYDQLSELGKLLLLAVI